MGPLNTQPVIHDKGVEETHTLNKGEQERSLAQKVCLFEYRRRKCAAKKFTLLLTCSHVYDYRENVKLEQVGETSPDQSTNKIHYFNCAEH